MMASSDSIFKRIFNWKIVRTFGESHIVKSSYYWIFFVPLAAKVLEYIKSPIMFNISGEIYKLNLELPFSWYFFYFAALFFAVGLLIYNAYCPSIISEFSNSRQFTDSGGEGFRLRDEIDKCKLNNEPASSQLVIEAYNIVQKRNGNKISRTMNWDWNWNGIAELNSEDISSLFFAIQSVAKYTHPTAIFLSLLSFLIGILLFFIVLVQNLLFVLTAISGDGVP